MLIQSRCPPMPMPGQEISMNEAVALLEELHGEDWTGNFAHRQTVRGWVKSGKNVLDELIKIAKDGDDD